MSAIKNFVLLFFAGTVLWNCNKITYRKTAGGMPYHVFESKDTQKIFPGCILKLNLIQKINDSVTFSTAGKMPYYMTVASFPNPYDLSELWTKLNKGDSIVAIQMMDTFIRRNPENARPQFKKGDRITTYVRILDVFMSDSLSQADQNREMVRYAPQIKKEQEEQEARQLEKIKQMQEQADLEAEQSGEAEKERKEMEAFLKSKNINARKMGKGTYVLVKEQGSGPAATLGKFVTVKYTGRYFRTDSVFQSSQFTFPVGKYQVISGWDEGVLAFNQGGKGILYIPGFRAYGKTPPPNAAFAPYEPLIFDIEVMSVSDTMPSTENKTRPMKKLTRQKQ